MGMAVTQTIPVLGLEVEAAKQRGLMAGAKAVAAGAAANAPYEDEARHGVHLRDTVYVRAAASAGDVARVEVGFTAFWAWWQHERLDYKHTQGHAKFLELALAEFGPAAMEEVALYLREVLGA